MQTDNISWRWKKSSRRKHIALHIDDSGHLEVRTPLRTSQQKVERLIIEKRAWIERSSVLQLQRIHPKLPQYSLQGELYLFGKRQTFTTHKALKSKLHYSDSQIIIETPTPEAFDRLMKQWYKQETQVAVEAVLEELKEKLSSSYNQVGYRFYKRRWGSCDSKNNLMFNSMLSAHKKEHIRYVVAHELAHIKEKNHSARFYAEGERILAGFKQLDKEMRH